MENSPLILPIYKNGDKTNPDKYRGIYFLDCTYKIYSRIINYQLEEELGKYQGGFRPRRSCPEQILSLKFIMNY